MDRAARVERADADDRCCAPARGRAVQACRTDAERPGDPADDRQLHGSHWVFRTIFDSGAPKLEANEIVGPIAVPSTSGKEVAYCASARVVLSRRKALVRLVQQPDGKVNVRTQVVIDQGPCAGDQVKPFPDLERARAALGKTD